MIDPRIVTINTAKGDLDYSQRLPWLSQALAALRPDVVLLQESLVTLDDRGASHDTAQQLSTATNLDQLVFAPVRRKVRLVDGMERDSLSGLAVLSRFPVKQSTVVSLPADPADGERICQLVLLEPERASLLVGNLHLTHLRGMAANTMRRAELGTILRHPWTHRQGGSFVIGGDFNTPLATISTLIEGHGHHLLDTWGPGGGSGLRATVPAPSPTRCLDYLFSVAANETGHGSFRDARVVLEQANTAGQNPSDHRGVMVTMSLQAMDDGDHA